MPNETVNLGPQELDKNIQRDMEEMPNEMLNMHLALDKSESIRYMALMLGIRYHVETIIKDPRYLELMMQREKEMKFSNDPDKDDWHLRPSTCASVIFCASMFEAYLSGKPSPIKEVGRAQGLTQESE